MSCMMSFPLSNHFPFVGKVFKFIDSKWQELDFQESFKITKIEGQVSISTPNCEVIQYRFEGNKPNGI